MVKEHHVAGKFYISDPNYSFVVVKIKTRKWHTDKHHPYQYRTTNCVMPDRTHEKYYVEE